MIAPVAQHSPESSVNPRSRFYKLLLSTPILQFYLASGTVRADKCLCRVRVTKETQPRTLRKAGCFLLSRQFYRGFEISIDESKYHRLRVRRAVECRRSGHVLWE